MSGLSGILNLDGSPVDRALLRHMTELIAHRGPDGAGYWTSGPVGFGHQMFRTTPESMHEKQPLENETGALCLTFDGRVDNREELAVALKSKGYQLRDDTDAELVLRAYECWGEDSASKILGDFAYALWDGRARRLFCARDILGLRPLYYYTDGRVFLFGSELRQIFEYKELTTRPNLAMLAEHLADEITSCEETVWQGVMRLPPAHVLVVEPHRAPRKTRYWDIDCSRKIRYAKDEEYAEHFLDVLEESVECRLRSLGPVGLEISGGLDSSSVTCVSASLKSERPRSIPELHALSLVFPGRNCDESRYFEPAVRQWNLAHAAVREELKNVPWYAGQTVRYIDLADNPSGAMMEPLFKAATDRGCRVLLNGIGGDHWFQGCSVGEPRWPAGSLPRYIYGFFGLCNEEGFAGALQHTGIRLRERFSQRGAVRRVRVPRWIQPDFARRTALAERINSAPAAHSIEPGVEQMRTLLHSGWTAHSNETTERSQSFAGIEGRSPFFDRRIIELAFAIPEDQRGRGERTKVVLRNAMRGLLPEVIRNRPDKAEFGHTACQTLDQPEARSAFRRLRLGEMGWIDAAVARRMYRRALAAHASGKQATRLWPLWMIFASEIWVERFVPADFNANQFVMH